MNKKDDKSFSEMNDEELAKKLFGERATEEIKRQLEAKEAEADARAKRST